MDILHLKEKVISLVAYMKDVGYTSQYIWYISLSGSRTLPLKK